ncbi:MAG: hypothetical protein KGL11_04735 [Alphaproteobacteria bacterium]|nr:hypothetical protein [Alphaproteobacteria bacterium]
MPSAAARPLLPAPIWVYNNWSAYDELSDQVPLTETLAMRELDDVLRLRKLGVRFDYYVMDAFWYDPDGGYRTWRATSWPNGPDRWLAALKANGTKPGLWFSTNTLTHMHAAPQWRDSLDKNGWSMALYRGGFLGDFMDVLQYWYDRDVRMFKFDMANFDAVAKRDEGMLEPHEARLRNLRAFHAALQAFRRRNPDVVLVGFNGLVGDVGSAAAPARPLNEAWLDVFDTFYSGDPRPSNTPEMSFWRSVDVYSDHMVRSFDQAGVPLPRIDSTSVMLGDTGTNYHRRASAWRGSALLMASHGGWINTVHGDLAFLDDDDARWLAKVQAIYDPLQRFGITKSFGGIPGDAYPYGFASIVADGALYVVVNPSQRIRAVRLPQLSPRQSRIADGRILFRDAGFEPVLSGNSVRLGPGQLVSIGFGRYADRAYDLSVERDIQIPKAIERLPARFVAVGDNAIETTAGPPAGGDLRIVMRQVDAAGAVVRSFSHRNMAQVFIIRATQGRKPLPVEIHYDKVVWSGLGWAVGEIRRGDLAPGQPIEIRIATTDPKPSLHLEGRLYRVEY